MFEPHFGLRENPFHSGHQMRFLYPSREHQEARAHLRYGIENREPFVLITGEVGTGKTTALYDALAEWGSKVSVALVTNSALTREEMIEEISLRFGLPLAPGTSKPQALSQLERHLLSVRDRGEHAVLLLDEAQNLAPDLLEEIRLLSNLEAQGEKLVQIFLVGQPELEAKLSDPMLRQLRQRISVHYRLNPLSPEETAGYIHHRISVAGGNPWAAFPPDACREVYRVTHGIPREINSLATQAMLTAYTEGETSVSPAHVQSAARENDFRSVLGEPTSLTDADIPMPAPPAAEAPATVVEPAPLMEPAPAAEPSPAPLGDAHANGESHAPVSIESTPEAFTAPVWSPPELEASEASEPEAAAATPAHAEALDDEPLQLGELDAWTRAAQELLQARRAAGIAPEPPVSIVSSTQAVVDPPRFPSAAELADRSAHADPGNTDLSGLPARLRQKIEDDIAREERNQRTMPLVLGGVAVVAIAIALVLAQRFQVIDLPFLRAFGSTAHSAKIEAPLTPAPATVAATTPVATPMSAADSTHAGADTARVAAAVPAAAPATSATPANPVTPAPLEKPAVVRPLPRTPATASNVALASGTPPAAKPAAPVVTPKPAPATVAATTPKPAASATPKSEPAAPVAAKPAAASGGTVFGVGVASYLDRDRATQERDRLAALSGLPGTVVPFNNSGTTMFRVVLGQYPSNNAATRAASDFVAKYGVGEAQPLLLSRGKGK